MRWLEPMDVHSAARAQQLYSTALERAIPSYPVTPRALGAKCRCLEVRLKPRPQQRIYDGLTRSKLLDPESQDERPSTASRQENARRCGGFEGQQKRMQKPAGSLRERIVLRSWLPDSLKMECLERLDKMEKALEGIGV